MLMCILCTDILSKAQLDNTDNKVKGTSANSGSTRMAHKAVNEGISVLSGGEQLPSLPVECLAPGDYTE